MIHGLERVVFSALVCVSVFTAAVVSAGEDPPSVPASAASVPTVPLVAGIARVRVEIARKHVIVVHDVNLARGAYRGDDLEAFAAFGSPGAPRAVEARLIPVPAGALEAPASDRGVVVPWSYASRRSAGTWAVLGRAAMAGVVVPLAADVMNRALAPSGMATLRLRALHPLPAADADGRQEVLVRLGDIGNVPLVVGRVEVASTEPAVEQIEARLCKAGILGERIAVRTVVPRAAGDPAAPLPRPALTAAVLATRKPGEDLCIRFMLGPRARSASESPAPSRSL